MRWTALKPRSSPDAEVQAIAHGSLIDQVVDVSLLGNYGVNARNSTGQQCAALFTAFDGL